MTISYPLALPSDQVRKLTPRMRAANGVSSSPFTFEQQVYAHPGGRWEFDVELAPMERADAEEWLGWLGALNINEGTFLIGDPKGATARGTWAGASPVLSGAHSARVNQLVVRGVDGLAWARGDWLQIGTGLSSRLHKVAQAGSQAGSPSIGYVDIWPRTRTTYSDGQAVVLSAPKALCRMTSPDIQWTIQELEYGLTFSCVEAL